MLYDPKKADLYLTSLFEEIDSYKIGHVDTIYLGGGTPTALSFSQLERLLIKIAPLLALNGEFTLEANIESINEEKLTLLKQYGVNRLSIGVQSFHDEVLRSVNRQHTKDDIFKKIALVKKYNFNFSIDLIYDLPSSSFEILKEDLQLAMLVDPPHIATYSLTVHPNTVFGIQKVALIDEETSRRNYDYILTFLRQHGYQRYEVSNFAKDFKYSRHNFTYWKNLPYYGVGLGAHGYVNGIRYENTKSLSKYLSGHYLSSQETINPEIDEAYYLMLHLRLEKGFDLSEFQNIFKHDFKLTYTEEIDFLSRHQLVEFYGNTFRATDEGLILLDYVLRHLLK